MINMGAVGGVGGQNLRDVEVQAGSVPKHIDQGRKACVARGRQERQGREEAMAVGVDGHVRAWIAKVSGNALCINQNPQCLRTLVRLHTSSTATTFSACALL